MSTVSSFKGIGNKPNVYRGKDFMKKFCESLRELAIKKKMKLLTKIQQELYENGKFTIFVKKSLKINILKIKNIVKLEIIAIVQVNPEVLNILYVI